MGSAARLPVLLMPASPRLKVKLTALPCCPMGLGPLRQTMLLNHCVPLVLAKRTLPLTAAVLLTAVICARVVPATSRKMAPPRWLAVLPTSSTLVKPGVLLCTRSAPPSPLRAILARNCVLLMLVGPLASASAPPPPADLAH